VCGAVVDAPHLRYDPATGRFTQEDPAGLAGGLNAYGFAGGDPVYDLGRTALAYRSGDVSKGELAAAGAGAGLVGFGGGYGRMARAAMGALDDLSAAAKVADRGGLTAAGRALAKHGGRAGSAFGQATGNPAALNRAGQGIVDDILTDPGSKFSARHHAKLGDVIEVRAPDGRGVRYNGKREFMGFLEP